MYYGDVKAATKLEQLFAPNFNMKGERQHE